jgi:hypothetical protein
MKGRLLLWQHALGKCQSILNLMERNKVELESDRLVKREEEHDQALREFAASHPDYIPGKRNAAHTQTLSEFERQIYPSLSDCIRIDSVCRMLVIVLFCQIFRGGNAERGKVADNKKARESHLEPILLQIFNEPSERKRFDELLKICLTARDKMIGHADGKKFNIEHQNIGSVQISSLATFDSMTDKIDYSFMRSFLAPLRMAVSNYADKME